MTLFLTELDVEHLLKMTDAVRLVEESLRDLGTGNAVNRPRQRVRVPHGILNVMPAGWSRRGYVGFKYYSSFPPKTRFWFHLIDANNGDILSIMQADRLGQQRTGAASGVATKYLARVDASTVGLLGTGWQAESQLEAICAVRDIRLARCTSPNAEHRKVFAKKMRARLVVDVRGVDSVEEAVGGADIVVTDDPGTLAYAGQRPGYTSLPLPWSRTYALVLATAADSAAVVAPSFRDALARDAVRVDARAAAGASAPPACSAAPPASSPPARTTARIAYPSADATARDLAARLAALGVAGARAILPLDGDALLASLRAGREAAYVVALPRTLALCQDLVVPAGAAVLPLVDTRAHALVRQGAPPMTVDWDGTLRLLPETP